VPGTDTIMVRAKLRVFWVLFLPPQEYEFNVRQRVKVFHLLEGQGETDKS